MCQALCWGPAGGYRCTPVCQGLTVQWGRQLQALGGVEHGETRCQKRGQARKLEDRGYSVGTCTCICGVCARVCMCTCVCVYTCTSARDRNRKGETEEREGGRQRPITGTRSEKREEECLTFRALTTLDASSIGKISPHQGAPTHAPDPADRVGLPSLLQRFSLRCQQHSS